MSLLTICQNAAREIGIDAPVFVINNDDTTAAQLLALCRRSVRELGKMGWPQFQAEYVFTTQYVASQACMTTTGSAVITGIPSTAGVSAGWVATGSGIAYGARVVTVDSGTQVTLSMVSTATGASTVTFSQESYPLPSDYLGMVDQSEWDRTNRWQLLGPLESQEWQVLRSGIAPVGPRFRFRLWQGKLFLDPAPSRNAVVAFEYISNNYIIGIDGTTKAEFTLDTDLSRIDEDLIELDLIWRFKRMKGLDFGQDYATAQNAISRDRGRLVSGRILNLASRVASSALLGSKNIPDTGFGA